MLITELIPEGMSGPGRQTVELDGVTYELVAWGHLRSGDPVSWDVVRLAGEDRVRFAHIIQHQPTERVFDVRPVSWFMPTVTTSVTGDLAEIVAEVRKHNEADDRLFAEEVGDLRGFAALVWAVRHSPIKSEFSKRYDTYRIPVYDALPLVWVTLRFETESRTVPYYDAETNEMTTRLLEFGPNGKYTVQVRNPEYQDEDVRLFDDPREAVRSAAEAANSAYT
ncbi:MULTISPECIES: hypothetical protein [Streptosporangium]|uniref:Uncharacterized protein (DUF1684 family) n=1 Tax=Streptosporangium brasiliense TaxID=47480 RepID=A0ABT9RMT6_9ACTN|nr:hypothetical protein [Streptosporangium brasiliense]MDP9870398.1 uncharacterized protein (DUF1684 family) [Streptosporangium brasiliense]